MTTVLQVKGMSCSHCVTSVKNALTAIPGVQSADVNLEQNSATIEHENVPTEMLIEAIEEEGYSASETP